MSRDDERARIARLARQKARREVAQRTGRPQLDQEFERARAASNSMRSASSAGDLVRSVVGQRDGAKLSLNQQAARAWYSCNGDTERRHTTGVYLRRGRGANSAPVLGVYVDSHAYLNDFSAQKDLYLSRLAYFGFQVSGIEFRLSKASYVARRVERTQKPQPKPWPQLDQQEEERVRQLCSMLSPSVPDSLKAAISRAVRMSFRRQKGQAGQN
ncbi:MAG: hypothetical protein PUD09_05025 [Coriobacteriales bacterium]|nr:hypothetical protein [Coriobacteriales bacterium]